MIAVGCLRLADGSVDEARALATLKAALDAGVDWIDTADVYAPDAASIGAGEWLVRRAKEGAKGARIATKGGLVRDGSRWTPDGRAGHLRAACEASLVALGVPSVDLYWLHAPDPRTPIATSARALEAIRREGLAKAIGICNATASQLEQALAVCELGAVQVRLGPGHDAALRGGVVALAKARGLQLFAHTPFGGARGAAKLARDPVLRAIAERHDLAPLDVALAWILDLGAIPIAGPTRPETARACGDALARAARLDDADRAALRERFGGERRPRPVVAGEIARAEVVVVMGLQGAGKTTIARGLVREGDVRLNRDARGGRLVGLLPELDAALARGVPRVVLDNTYLGRASRAQVIEVAARHGAAARCVFVDVSLERAQASACARLVAAHGGLPMPEDLARLGRSDPRYFGPNVLFRAQRDLERPRADEGWSSIEIVPGPPPVRGGDRGAVVFEASALLSGSRDAAARELAAQHPLRLGTAWCLDAAALARVDARLGFSIAWSVCPHPAGPPVCWCRKPLPGLAIAMILERGLDPAAVVHAGGGAADRGFAARAGFRFVDLGGAPTR